MATRNIYTNLNLNDQELQAVSLEKLAADPTGAGLYAGRIWYNTTDNRIRHYDGTTVHTLAHMTDLEQFGALVGTHDATTGIPTAGSGDAGAIRKGDYWIVSVAGTIAGIGGDDVLAVGDLLIATADAAAAATDFTAVEVNLNLNANLVQGESVTLATLPGNTPTAIPTTFTTTYSFQVFDSTGEDITSGVTITSAGNIESNKALANLTIWVVGIA